MCLPCTCKAQMPAGTEGETQLTQVVLKGLGDKLYDKRKAAALEVEQLIKNLSKEVTHKFASPRHTDHWINADPTASALF